MASLIGRYITRQIASFKTPNQISISRTEYLTFGSLRAIIFTVVFAPKVC